MTLYTFEYNDLATDACPTGDWRSKRVIDIELATVFEGRPTTLVFYLVVDYEPIDVGPDGEPLGVATHVTTVAVDELGTVAMPGHGAVDYEQRQPAQLALNLTMVHWPLLAAALEEQDEAADEAATERRQERR